MSSIITIVGRPNSGKSTLLESIAHIRRPAQGVITFDGGDAWAGGKSLAVRQQVPMLLQRTVLFSTTVLENVMFGLRVRHVTDGEAKSRAEEALCAVGMAGLAHRRHDELSGGEKRRVALARILALDCRAIVLDEPTAGLDRESEGVIEGLVRRLHREEGKTVLFASHNHRQAIALGTRVLTLISGKLIPRSLDNIFVGELQPASGGWTFRDRQGWQTDFQVTHMLQDAWEGIGPATGAVHVAVPASGIQVAVAGQPSSDRIRGVVDAVQRDGDRGRVRICLAGGPKVRAEVSAEELAQPGFALGQKVAMTWKSESVIVLPLQTAQADQEIS